MTIFECLIFLKPLIAGSNTKTNYYAFGMAMQGRKFSGSSGYRYGFNGKENDKETVGTGEGTQDYGFRIYNPSLGKFLSIDPLTKSYPWYTPYQFAGNKPIKFADLDGAEEDEKGTLSSMNFMTPELKVATLTKVLSLRLTSVHGSNFMPVPKTEVNTTSWANAYYNDGVIYVNPNMQFNNFEDQISVVYHEYKHYLNECNSLFKCSDDKGKIVSYNTGETYMVTPSDEKIKEGMKDFDEVILPTLNNPTKEVLDKIREAYKITISTPIPEEFTYSPSNLALDEISAYKTQLAGEKDGLYKLTDETRNDINQRIKSYTDIYNKRVDYEERHNLNSDGSSKSKPIN